MLQNYFRVAIRNFRNHKLFTAINVLGLAIGISAALVIYLIVQYEFSYEKNWENGNRIYRITSEVKFPGMSIYNGGVSVPTVEAIRNEVTGLEELTHIITLSQEKISIPGEPGGQLKTFRRELDIMFADSMFFSFFPHKFLAGDASTALGQPFSTVLTESRARTYFDDLEPAAIIGRAVVMNDTINTTVTGIIKDLDAVSDLAGFKMFISSSTIRETGLRRRWSWNSWNNINSSSQLFVRLQPGTDPAHLLPQLADLREKYRERHQQGEKDHIVNQLQPLYAMHFDSQYGSLGHRVAHKPTLVGLTAVAVFLLLLGCINFINLSTAQASARAREIGIRKTLGSGKGQLIRQFLAETFVLTLFATALSVALVPWLLHIFAGFIPPGVSFSSLNYPHVWIFLLALLLLVTLLAGMYPAWVLTRFKPVTVMKNQFHTGGGQSRKALLRKALTVTQFVIAQFLLIATLVVAKQIHYSINKDLGYTREAIGYFSTPFDFYNRSKDVRRLALLQELKELPGISMISLADGPPATPYTNSTEFTYKDGDEEKKLMVEVKLADTIYFNLYGMKLVAGRNLLPSDTTREFVVNEAFTRAMGFQNPADAIGRMVDNNGLKPVVGVLADFHTKSTHMAIEPLAYSAEQSNSFEIHLSLQAGMGVGAWKDVIEKVESAYKRHFPDDDFRFSFFDESIASFYAAETTISRLLVWATGLCLFISCLGLLGLVIFVTNSRTKEIGVRKVLGASVTQIVSLLSRDFILLVLTAFLIAMPVAWWAMHQWLQDFVYRTSISWWIFGITGAGMLLIALLVLSARTIQSAMANPVKSLRTE